MANKTVDLNNDADTKDSEFTGILEVVTETDNSMTIGQGQPERATDVRATFTNFQSVEEVIKFYKLPIKKTRRTSSKASYEDFSAATLDSKTLSNAFTTDQKRLGFWILALKNVLHIDKKYKLNVNNKTNKNEINEIEIKVIDLESGIGCDYTILTIHVFLTTALIQCRGILKSS